jgi:hypothetical protein
MQSFMVGNEFTESLRCAYKFLDWQAEWEIHISRLLMRAGVCILGESHVGSHSVRIKNDEMFKTYV